MNDITDKIFIMDSYNIDNRMSLASAEETKQVNDSCRMTSSISSEPLDRYIHELRNDLQNELRKIASIKWK